MNRFWDKVDKSGDCWMWTGSLSRDGYGHFRPGGIANPERAQRVSWRMHYGVIPKGRQVLHSCDNPGCVNPAHLFLGTNLANVADRQRKGRQARGIMQGSAKLTDNDVRLIRKLGSLRLVTQRNIGIMFNVHKSQIHRIIKFKQWAHVE